MLRATMISEFWYVPHHLMVWDPISRDILFCHTKPLWFHLLCPGDPQYGPISDQLFRLSSPDQADIDMYFQSFCLFAVSAW